MHTKKFMSLETSILSYIKKFYSADDFIQENIRLKEEHIFRVARIMQQLADSLHLSDTESDIARITALLHDIGRFQQFATFKTFHDASSCNHATLGIEIIKNEQFIAALPLPAQNSIIQAVQYHNMQHLPGGLTGHALLFAKMVRDADKLDIYHIFSDYFKQDATERNPGPVHGLPDTTDFSSHLADDILANRVATNSIRKSCNDIRLGQLSWIFDINFSYSFHLIHQKNYYREILSYLPDTPLMRQVATHINEYLAQKISSYTDNEDNNKRT